MSLDNLGLSFVWCINTLDIELIPFLEKDQDVLDILQTMFG